LEKNLQLYEDSVSNINVNYCVILLIVSDINVNYYVILLMII